MILIARFISICLALFVVTTGYASAGAFEEGVAAYDAGDYKRAFNLWQQQIEDDENPAAQRNLAHLYRQGLGVERDAHKARALYEDAARQGLAGAQANLGRMYLRGDGIPQDYKKAHHWLTQAARNNHIAARYRLATMYDYGLGRPANPEAALLWYSLAGKSGHKAALDRMVTLVALMPPPQIAPLPGMEVEEPAAEDTAEPPTEEKESVKQQPVEEEETDWFRVETPSLKKRR